MKKIRRIVVIGGGTGTYGVLLGLKNYPVNLSAIISMMDSGGSNRVLRDEFGLLPTSDIRQCMVALASDNSHEVLRKLFTYRYESGVGIAGMTFGNLFMAALTDIYKSQEESLRKTCEILDVQGKVIPVTYDNAHLVARYDNGNQVLGEHYIDEPDDVNGKHKIVELETIPIAIANPSAIRAIKTADMIVLGPGDLYTSIICNLVVDGITKAIRESKAEVVYVVNLMTKFGQTNNFSAAEHVNEIEKYLGDGVVDYVLVNSKLQFPRGILARYKQEKAAPVKDNLENDRKHKVIRRSLVSDKVYKKSRSDKVKRSLIRHDPDKLAKALVSLL